MDKNAIKKYAVWARNELIARVSQKAQQYGITAEGYGDKNADSVNDVLLSATEKKQRQALIAKIEAEGFEQVMEEVAYTWFNRFTALRFMEVNNYLPSHTRVFTNEVNEFKPQILADAISLELEGLDIDKVFELKNANKDEELYKYLIIVQCNELNSLLPEMFKEIEDYSSLLLPDNLLRKGSIIEQMVECIPEEDWSDQVEIIGWLYQYYINDPKDALINAKKQYKSKDIPFVTQIFTSDWIVRFMVQNSIGRFWEEHSDKDIKEYDWEYYLDSGVPANRNTIDPKDIRVIDPCMGSGHILVYVFDVLLQIYESYGYTSKEAVEYILQDNLYGLDISERAYQLSYFSVMMKARKYNRTILKKGIKPHLYVLSKKEIMSNELISFISRGNSAISRELTVINSEIENIDVIGSLARIKKHDYKSILNRIDEIGESYFDNIIELGYQKECIRVREIIEILEALSNKYEIVVTNPPYMNSSYMPNELKKYVQKEFEDEKNDLFAAFITKTIEMCKENGHIGLLTPFVWMFISSYEKLRRKLLEEIGITSLVQLEYNAFEGACVPVCSFTMKKSKNEHLIGEYIRLSEFKGIDRQSPKTLEAVENKECGYRFSFDQANYNRIPGVPFVYWISEHTLATFDEKSVDDMGEFSYGVFTCDNKKFLRMWYEVDKDQVAFNGDNSAKRNWCVLNKGGTSRKWFGNLEYIVNYGESGGAIRTFRKSKGQSESLPGENYYFMPHISWSLITSASLTFRYYPPGMVFDISAPAMFNVDEDELYLVLALLNSKVGSYYIALFNPTMNNTNSDIKRVPYLLKTKNDEIVSLVKDNIRISKEDWDSRETAWDFNKSPLLGVGTKIEEAIMLLKKKREDRIHSLKLNEESLNSIFIELYGLSEVISTTVEDEEISLTEFDEQASVKELISYAVGCMFGRYSLNKDGLICAGPAVNEEDFVDYLPDIDGIIPITDDEYFNDDIVNRFEEFLEIAFSKETLEENLNYIAKILGGKGSPREVIRNYFLTSFFDDHVKMYQKRPIYWLFDSGKKNGFKCLVYAHRYKKDTIARIRTDYVHEIQSRYRTVIADIEQRINNASTSERVKLNKQLKSVQDKDEELRKYEEKIHHLADQMISIDLDDGVKENYAKFQDVLAKIK